MTIKEELVEIIYLVSESMPEIGVGPFDLPVNPPLLKWESVNEQQAKTTVVSGGLHG